MTGWRAVVPVKRLESAKSRMDLPPDERAALTTALLSDTLAALAATPEIGRLDVVSADPSLAALAAAHGATLVDPGVAVGIDAEVAAAIVDDRGPVLVVLGDLPCLRSEDLSGLLEDPTGSRPRFVPDAAGTGTTMVLLGAGTVRRTSFGPGSAARHATFADPVVDAPAGLRRDVDTLADLDAAIRQGPGESTSAWWSTGQPSAISSLILRS